MLNISSQDENLHAPLTLLLYLAFNSIWLPSSQNRCFPSENSSLISIAHQPEVSSELIEQPRIASTNSQICPFEDILRSLRQTKSYDF